MTHDTTPDLYTDRPASVRSPALTILAAILLACACMDVIFFTGYYACDDMVYLRAATSLLETGRIADTSDIGSLRLVMVGWCWLVARLISPNVQLIAASFVAFHLALVVLTYRLASRVYEVRTGLTAAWIVGTVPLILHHATQIHTDLPMACFMVAAVLLMIEAYSTAGPWRAGFLLTAAGLAAGLAYGVKESGLVILPWCFGYWLFREARAWTGPAKVAAADVPAQVVRRHGRQAVHGLTRGGLFLIGFAAFAAVEAALLRSLTGRDDLRLAWTQSASIAGAEAKYLLDGGASPIGRLRGFAAQLDHLHFPLSLRVIGLAALATYPFLRMRRWAVPLAGVWIFGYLVWGTVNFRSYLPPSQHPRYFIPAIPFLGIACAAALVCLCDVARRIRVTPRLVRASGGLALAALIMAPLLNLDTADRIAGRGWGATRASFVGSATEAIRLARVAARGRNRPVVLASLVAEQVRPLLGAARPADILLAADLSVAEVRRLLDGGGFYYVDNNRTNLLQRDAIPSNPIDDLMHNATLVGGDWDDCAVALRTVWPEVLLASADEDLSFAPPDPVELKIARLASVAPTPSRIGDLLARYARIIPGELATCDHSYSVDVFRVTTGRRQHMASDERDGGATDEGFALGAYEE